MLKKIAVGWVLALPALAQDAKPHHIDFTQEIIGYNHKPIEIPSEDAKVPSTALTLFDVAATSLETPIQSMDGQNPDAVAKVKRDHLTSYIFDHRKDAILSIEDIEMILARAKVIEPSAILGPAWKALDPVGYEKAVK